MRFSNKTKVNSVTIQGATVTTPTGEPEEGSKAEAALKIISTQYQVHQLKRRAQEVAQMFMKELEIPDNASIVGYLCGGVAKSNLKEITDWILRETANSIDELELLYDSEFLQELSLNLLSILMEVQHDCYR